MKIFIDKENLHSLFEAGRVDKRKFRKCIDLLREELHVHYNFPKDYLMETDEYDLLISDIDDPAFIPTFAETSAAIVPNREQLKTNFYKQDCRFLFSIFLINDNHIAEFIQTKNAIAIAKVGDELNLLYLLSTLSDNDTYAYKISDWTSFLPIVPFTDVIIKDEHYFKNREEYETNDNELIRAVCHNHGDSPINLIIITKPNEIDPRIDLEKERKSIVKLVRDLTSSKSTVTILTSNKVHDRAMVTNYYTLTCGCSFDLHKHVRKDVRVNLEPHIKDKYYRLLKEGMVLYNEIFEQPVKCYGPSITNFTYYGKNK